MPFSVMYLEDFGAVQTVYAGSMDVHGIEVAITATGVCAREHECARFLADCRDLDAGGSVLDVWSLGDYLASLPHGNIEREAVLLPASAAAADELRFFETVCRNRGLDVRVFGDRDEALAWLAQ